MDRPRTVSRWKRYRPWVIGGAGLVLVLVVALFLIPRPGSGAVEASDIRTATAANGLFEDFLPVRATLEPSRSVFLDAVEGGRVEQLHVDDGALVEPGQLIATLSNPQLELQVVAQEAAIFGQLGAASSQQLSLRRSELDQQKELNDLNYNLLRSNRALEVKRYLHERDIESDAGLQNAEAEARYYSSQVQATSRNGASTAALIDRQSNEIAESASRLRDNLRAVRASLSALEVRASVRGRLTALEIQPGQTVERGARIAQIDSDREYKLTSAIDEFYLGRIAVGQPARATHGRQALAATVSRTLPQVADGKFRVELTFDGAAPQDARRGQTLDTRITLGESRNALIVPSGAWLEATGGNWVFVVDESGRQASRRAIVTGRRNPTQVEILEGLKPGERIITSNYATIEDRNRLLIR